MKTIYKVLISFTMLSLVFAGCSDFEDINHDPTKVDKDKVKTYFLLNRSITKAQMDPFIAERVFVYQWKSAARYERRAGLATGANYDEYNKEYLGTGFGVGWLNDANLAIVLAEERVLLPNAGKYEANVLQMARIWRAYVASELADCFGPISVVNKYDGVIQYEDVETIYKWIISELKDAGSKLNKEDDMSEVTSTGTDAFYNGKVEQWRKFANSLRLRYAMRLSKADPTFAKQAFEEAAATNDYITSLADMAHVQEVDGWHELAGVMSRDWNHQQISVTLNNMMIGLGGIDFQVPADIAGEAKLKDARQYMGMKFSDHLTTMTNDPSAGYFFDALPSVIDPRATVLFHIPGYDGGVAPTTIQPADSARLLNPKTETEYVDAANKEVYKKLNTKYTWNTWVTGNWDKKGTLSTQLTGQQRNYPCLSKFYRNHSKKRVFFAPWESYFLLAEAALYGWNVPGTAKENYEKGIASSFEYHGVSEFLAEYIKSKEYNRVGTSVEFDHMTEAENYTVEYIDGYTGKAGTATYEYPHNAIYSSDRINNDKLTKIITQKYLAQCPWLPLEAWSDHRRLGLPFFENPAVEVDLTSSYQIPLTTSNYKECKWEFYVDRMMYPTTMQINSEESYNTAVKLLGGSNSLYTPLWWTGRK